jgi:hypothetical protein
MMILVDAIGCCQSNVEAMTLLKRREFREAQNWMFNGNDDVFSLDAGCYVLDTDTDLLRRRLIQIQWGESRLSGADE